MNKWKKDMLKTVKRPLTVISGAIVDRDENLIALMNRETGKRPLSPVQTDELCKELVRCFNQAHPIKDKITTRMRIMKIFVATQCVDARTKQTGTFGFNKAVKTTEGNRFYSVTPVFPDLIPLIDYCKIHEIKMDYAPKNHEDVLP